MRNRSIPDPTRKMRLQPRDREILVLIFLHRALTRDHLMAIAASFRSIPRINARLRAMYDASLLRKAYIATGAYGSQTLYVLGPAAAPLVAADLGLPEGEVRRYGSYAAIRSSLEHALLAADLRLAATLGAKQAGYGLRRYLPEPAARHEYLWEERGTTSRQILKPDAYFEVQCGERRLGAFLEADRGHCAEGQIAKSLASYGAYARRGLYEEIYHLPSFVVCLVTTAGERRIRNLRSLQSERMPELLLTTKERVAAHGFFGSIWYTGHANEPVPFLATRRAGGC